MSEQREGIGNNDAGRSTSTQTAEALSLADAINRAEAAERRVRELEAEVERLRLPAGHDEPSRVDTRAGWVGRAGLFEATLDAMTDGVIIYDRDGHMLHTNPANREILGNEAAWKDYFARPIEDRLELLRMRDEAGQPLPDDQWPHLRVLRGEILANETAARVRARDLNGREKRLIITGAPVRNAAGEIIGAVCIHRDVSERYALHDEAARRGVQLEAIFDAIADGLYVYDAQGQLIQTNAAAASYDPLTSSQEYRAQRLAERIQDAQPRGAQWNPLATDALPVSRILRGEALNSANSVDTLVRSRDGHETYFNVSGSPMRDADGRIIGAVIVTRDVTKRLRMEQEHAERASLLDAIFEAVPDRVSLFDRHGQLIRMNSAAQRNSGPRRGGEHLDEFQAAYTLRKPDGEPFPTEELPTMRSLRGETVTNVEMLFRAPDGSDQLIVANSAPILNPAGDIIGVVSITHDVTEQRRLAARTRESLDALLQMARLLVEPAPDDAGDREDAPAANLLAHRLATLTCSVLGCTRVSLSVVEPETQLVKPLTVVGMSPEDTRAWFQEQTDHATRLGEGADPDLIRRFNAGEVLVIDMTQPPYNALPNPYNITTVLTVALRVGEQVVGLLALDHSGAEHHYTTDEMQLARAIAQLTALVVERDRLLQERATREAQVLALEETNRRMSEFLSIASHELRTPLTSAIANTQLAEKQMRRLREEETEEGTAVRRLRWLVTRTEQQLRRQNRLVSDLLDVSRIEAGMLVMDRQPCDIVTVVREAVEEQRIAHPGRVIKLSAPPAHTPIEAVVDADRIGQVVTNFLTNALKYSAQDAPVYARVSAHAGRARVTVHDHGPGLPAEEREAIWEQFHRAPGVEVLSGSGVGLGIGLYISRTIIERHGGAVGVRSALGEGSTFWFEVPCDAAPLPDSAEQ